MEHARQRLRLMQLSSSSLPVGSFTWSQGLEWAVEAGWVASVEAFRHWQIQQMEQSFFCVDLPLFMRLYRACEQQDLTAAKRWAAYLLACRETRELREEERNRGAAFTRLVKSWEPLRHARAPVAHRCGKRHLAQAARTTTTQMLEKG